MSTKWGSYVHIGGGAYLRVGLSLSVAYPGGVLDSTDTQATVSWALLAQLDGAFANGTDSWTITGDHSASGSKSWSINSNGGTTTIASGSYTVSLIYGSSQTESLTGKLFDIAGSTADATVTHSVTVGARPYQDPAMPSGLTVARVNDSQQTLSWTRNATTAAPYHSQRIRRWDNVSNAWTVIKDNVSGTASSYTDATTRSDRRYRYAVEAVNSSGSSGWFYGTNNVVYTTPAAPGKPAAAKTSTGDIKVTRGSLSDAAEAWEVWHAADGVWDASALATVDDATTSWTWPSPDPTKVHTFRLRATVPTPALASSYSSTSDPVQLVTSPAAPTVSVPAAHDASEDLEVEFEHNPLDTTPLSAYELEHRPAGSTAAWTTTGGKTAATTGLVVLPGGTWTNPATVDIRVRTWGEHPDPGPYTTVQVQLSARPVVDVTSPADGSVWPSPKVTAGWDFFDAEGSAQAAWDVKLLDGSGTDVLDGASGFGATDEVDLGARVADGGTYQLHVVGRDGVGLDSAVATSTFTVTYALPPAPSLTPTWDKDTGTVTVQWDTPAPGVSEVEVDHVRIDRAHRSGWVTVADDLPASGVVVDMVPPTGTVVTYRAVAVSALPSEALSAPAAVATPTRYVFLNYGPGFGQVVRLWADLTAGRGFSREKEVKVPAGAEYGIGFTGEARTRTYNLSAKLFDPTRSPDPSSSWEDVEDLQDAPDPVCLRDPEGVRMFVQVGGVDLSEHLSKPHRPVTIPLRQIDWEEQVVT